MAKTEVAPPPAEQVPRGGPNYPTSRIRVKRRSFKRASNTQEVPGEAFMCSSYKQYYIYTLLRNRPFCGGGKAEVWTAHFLPGAGPPGLRTVSCFCWSWSLAFLYLRPLERWDREGSALRYWGLAQRWRHLATQK